MQTIGIPHYYFCFKCSSSKSISPKLRIMCRISTFTSKKLNVKNQKTLVFKNYVSYFQRHRFCKSIKIARCSRQASILKMLEIKILAQNYYLRSNERSLQLKPQSYGRIDVRQTQHVLMLRRQIAMTIASKFIFCDFHSYARSDDMDGRNWMFGRCSLHMDPFFEKNIFVQRKHLREISA